MHRTLLLTLARDYSQTLKVAKVQYKLRVASGLNLPDTEVLNEIWKKILVWNRI